MLEDVEDGVGKLTYAFVNHDRWVSFYTVFLRDEHLNESMRPDPGNFLGSGISWLLWGFFLSL
jgi:hypothetical protein